MSNDFALTFRIGRIIGFRTAYRIARAIDQGDLPQPDYDYSLEKAVKLARIRLNLPDGWVFSHRQLKRHASDQTIDRYTAFGATAILIMERYYPETLSEYAIHDSGEEAAWGLHRD